MNVYLISKALLSRAGPNFQQLLSNASSGAQVSPGSFFKTSGGNLNCQEVLHVVPPAWENGQGASDKVTAGLQCVVQIQMTDVKLQYMMRQHLSVLQKVMQ